ncbi:dUTP diphosphatase [bacterium]|nr:dUTP diphosphatase [bacterium]
MEVKISLLENFDGLDLPDYETAGSAGFDLKAACSDIITIPAGKVSLIPTGIKFQIPNGFELQIRPRSGLALKKNIGILNSPGTIDSDYRGEVKIILINLSNETFIVNRGMRIAQAIISPVYRAKLNVVENLSQSERGSGGFGHTGT